jgi:hypothetical protein
MRDPATLLVCDALGVAATFLAAVSSGASARWRWCNGHSPTGPMPSRPPQGPHSR